MIDENILLNEIQNKETINIDELKLIIERIKKIEQVEVKSSPEAILYYYIYKYIDKNVVANKNIQIIDESKNKKLNLNVDIYFSYKNINYIIEFDSLSYHSKEEEIIRDEKKNKILANEGYKIIRLRNHTTKKFLPNLSNCYNIPCRFNYFNSKKEMKENNETLHKLLYYITNEEYDFDFVMDLKEITKEPYWKWRK